MKTENQTNPKPKKRKTAKKILLVLVIILLILIIGILFIIPAYVSSDSGRKTIITKINDATGGSADFSSLSMSWFSGINLKDLSFNDKTGSTSVKIKEIQTKPHYASILAGSISFGETIIDRPQVSITLPATTEHVESKSTSEKSMQPVALPVSRIDLKVNDGSLRITDPTTTGPSTVELQQINSSLNLRPPSKPTQFELSTVLADNTNLSQIKANGTIQPNITESGFALSGTNADLDIEVNDLKLESLESFFALAGVDIQAKGNATGKITSQIKDGQIQQLNADIKGSNIEITGEPLKGDSFKTDSLTATSRILHENNFIKIVNLNMKTDWLSASASGDIYAKSKTLADFLNAESQQDLAVQVNCDVAKLAAQMPNTLGLQKGTALTSGTLTANIEKTSDAGQPKLLANAKLENISGMVSNQPASLSQPIIGEAVITSDAKKIRFDKLNLSSSFAAVNGSGTTESLDYTANINLGNFQSELGRFIDMAGYKLAGTLESNGKLTASAKKYQLNGSSAAKDLTVTSPRKTSISEPAATANYTMDIDTESSLMTIKSFQTNAAFGRVDIRDSVIPLKKDNLNKLALNIIAKSLNLARVMPIAELFSPAARDLKLSGLADSELLIKPENGGYSIRTDSTNISNFEFAYKDKKPFKQNQISAKFDSRIEPQKLTASGELTCPDIKIKFNFDKAVSGQNANIKGDAQLAYNWSAVTDFASQFIPDELKLEGQRKDSLSFSSSYPAENPKMLWSNLTAKLPKIGFDKAEYRGLVFEPTEIDVQIQKGLFTIAPFTSKVNQGQINFAASANFNDPVPILKIPAPQKILQNVKIDETISVKILRYLNPIFEDVDRVSGIASFEAKTLAIPLMGGSVKDFVLDGNFSVKDLQLVSPFFKAIQRIRPIGTDYSKMQIRPTNVVAKDGMLRYDNMQLEVGENPFNFVERANLITKMHEEGSKVILPYTTGRTIKIGEENTPGRIVIPYKGPLDKPQLDTGKLIEQNLGNILEGVIKDGEIDLEGLKDILK